MPLITDKIEFQPGDEIFTTEIMTDDLLGRGARATISEVYKNTLFVHYGVWTDFCEVNKNSCIFVKRPAIPIITMPGDIGFF